MKAQLILENGKRFSGEMFGSQKNIAGEVIFVSGGVIGYQEIISDPAYAGQIVIMTFPLIGNYGINLEQENDIPSYLSAIIVRDKCDEPSNFRCEMTFEEYLQKKDVVGLYGIDTRSLTKIIRDNGVMKGVVMMGEPDEDEVHRYAITYHRTLRTVSAVHSELDNIVGVGEKKRSLLLEKFGSIEKIANAEREELLKSGIDSKTTDNIIEYFNKKE